jgi:hypothetical protein
MSTSFSKARKIKLRHSWTKHKLIRHHYWTPLEKPFASVLKKIANHAFAQESPVPVTQILNYTFPLHLLFNSIQIPSFFPLQHFTHLPALIILDKLNCIFHISSLLVSFSSNNFKVKKIVPQKNISK